MSTSTPPGALSAYWQSTLHAEPAADLWSRIEAAEIRRLGRRRRVAAGAMLASVALVAGIALAGRHATPLDNDPHGTNIDWQARAQALEVQLRALDAGLDSTAATDASAVEAELGEADRRLQTAYELGADPNQRAALWKRRSELLDALIVARKQGLMLTRI
jgi:hypothetical protein